jgi:hypothetical protein
MSSHEGQHATLAVHRETVCVRDHLNRVNGPACKAIDGVEDLERSNEIELIDWRDDDDDDAAGRRGAVRAGFPGQ